MVAPEGSFVHRSLVMRYAGRYVAAYTRTQYIAADFSFHLRIVEAKFDAEEGLDEQDDC